jgi:fluoroquinolone transport system permease protein
MNWRSIIYFEMSSHWKNGFYHVYAFISIFYIILLNILPSSWLTTIGPILLFSEPSLIGLYFVGAGILLERDQNILQGIFATPFQPQEYMFSKLISFGIIASLSGGLMYLGVWKNVLSLPAIMVFLFLASTIYTQLGIIISSITCSMNEYILNIPLFFIPILIPAGLSYTNLPASILLLIPSSGVFLFLKDHIQGVASTYFILYLINILLTILILIPISTTLFKRSLGSN